MTASGKVSSMICNHPLAAVNPLAEAVMTTVLLSLVTLLALAFALILT